MKLNNKTIAVMQPYVFPYIGYFQLIHAVDEFIFLDDVNFIKRGWINRNNILFNNEKKLITFPCKNISQNRYINQVEIDFNNRDYNKLLKTIELSYRKAPYFDIVMELIQNTLFSNSKTISELAALSILNVSNYLKISTGFLVSSECFRGIENFVPTNRLLEICSIQNANYYINAIGGQKLYKKECFTKRDIELKFLIPEILPYKQFNESFIGGLSIIDVLMFNDIETIQQMLSKYDLI